MKIFKCNQDQILINRETGGAGNKVYAPDSCDDYIWVAINRKDYDKWKDKNNQNLINRQIINAIAQAPTIIDSDGSELPINIESLNIKFDDTVYTFKQLMNDSGVTLFNDADLFHKEYLIERNNQ